MLLELSGCIRLVISIVVAITISIVIYKPLYLIALKKGFLKKTNGRSSHIGKVPDFGGILIFSSLFFTFTALVKFPHKEMQFFLLAVSTIWVVGIFDDILQIRPRYKFVGEIISVFILVVGGEFYLTNLHGLFGIHEINPWFGALFTMFILIGIINSINMIDGIDGLCSGISALIISTFSVWFLMNNYWNYAIIGFSVVASLIPFFIRNVFCIKTKIFLGDNGSLMLGLILGVFVVKFCELNITENTWQATKNAPGIAFCFMSIPVIDTIRLMIYRTSQGRSPFNPDKSHIHHKFLQIFNDSHKKSTFIILLLQLILIIVGFIFQQYPNEILISIAFLLFAFMYTITYITANKVIIDKVTDDNNTINTK